MINGHRAVNRNEVISARDQPGVINIRIGTVHQIAGNAEVRSWS